MYILYIPDFPRHPMSKSRLELQHRAIGDHGHPRETRRLHTLAVQVGQSLCLRTGKKDIPGQKLLKIHGFAGETMHFSIESFPQLTELFSKLHNFPV